MGNAGRAAVVDLRPPFPPRASHLVTECAPLPSSPRSTPAPLVRPLGVPRQIEPLRQLHLRNEQEDRRGDLTAPGFRARHRREPARIEPDAVRDEQARPGSAIDEPQPQPGLPLPAAGRDAPSAERLARRPASGSPARGRSSSGSAARRRARRRSPAPSTRPPPRRSGWRRPWGTPPTGSSWRAAARARRRRSARARPASARCQPRASPRSPPARRPRSPPPSSRRGRADVELELHAGLTFEVWLVCTGVTTC